MGQSILKIITRWVRMGKTLSPSRSRWVRTRTVSVSQKEQLQDRSLSISHHPPPPLPRGEFFEREPVTTVVPLFQQIKLNMSGNDDHEDEVSSFSSGKHSSMVWSYFDKLNMSGNACFVCDDFGYTVVTNLGL
ncbi:hypothetical protein Hdeb2414_s0006g00203351 [Helianthus debilis subsp. tardiflorus]